MLIVKLKSKNALVLAHVAVKALRQCKLPVKTITATADRFDNGLEFACHEHIARQLKAVTYFANPYHSWERGLNENTNGLIRQYIPKSCPISIVRPSDVSAPADRLAASDCIVTHSNALPLTDLFRRKENFIHTGSDGQNMTYQPPRYALSLRLNTMATAKASRCIPAWTRPGN